MSAAAVAGVVGIIAVILIVTTGAAASGPNPLAIPFMLYALLPYGALYFVGRQVEAWNPEPNAAFLATVTGGDRDLKRWRLRVHESPQSVVYDEVFSTAPRLIVAKSADGTSNLFVSTDARLHVLRPRADGAR